MGTNDSEVGRKMQASAAEVEIVGEAGPQNGPAGRPVVRASNMGPQPVVSLVPAFALQPHGDRQAQRTDEVPSRG